MLGVLMGTTAAGLQGTEQGSNTALPKHPAEH
jgi:hypothetical protein